MNYCNSTVAPTSSNFFFNSSAASFATFSLTVLGAPSTRSLASFNPNPVASLTTLITWIFCAPASFNTTLKLDFSSAAPAAAPAAGAATAAADTPYFSSIFLTNSANSTTVKLSIYSNISSTFAILNSSFFIVNMAVYNNI